MIELRQLQYFVALAEELHFGRASERLRISKPTLSQQIRVLERNVGVALLERGHHLRLTEPGDVLLHEARQLLKQFDRLQNAVATAARQPSALEVRVTNGLEFVLREPLAALSGDEAPPVNLAITNGLDAEHAVAAGRADAALIWWPSGTQPTLHTEQVGQARVSLVLPHDHRLAQCERVPVAAVQGERVALFRRQSGPGVYDAFVAHLFPHGVDPRQIVTPPGPVARLAEILELVSVGGAVAPFVHDVALALEPPGVILRPLDPPLSFPIHLVSREPRRPQLRAFAQLLLSGTGLQPGS